MPPTARRQPLRAGAATLGIAAAFALAGCAGTVDTATDDEQPDAPASTDPADPGTQAGSGPAASTYADGTYTAQGAYRTPETIEQVTVTVTLADDIVTAVEVVGDPQTRESTQHQGEFIGGIADIVVGEDIDQLQVSRVAGSSLTSGGFNEAIEAIRAEAAR